MRLSKLQIREIIIDYDKGLDVPAIADKHGVDVSTAQHHIADFEQRYGSVSYVYSVITVPKPRGCTHPSLKCLVCGQAQDHIHRRELEEISQLRIQLAQANERLQRYGDFAL